MNRAWITNLASALVACCGCLSNAAPNERGTSAALERGSIASGIRGRLIAAPLSDGVAITVHSDIGLVVDRVNKSGQEWLEIVSADAVVGWTNLPVHTLGIAEVSSGSNGLTLFSKSPDDAEFNNSDDQKVAPNSRGTVIGASKKKRPFKVQQLLPPPRLRRDVLPWLNLRFESSTGYAPFDEVWLSWPRSENPNNIGGSFGLPGGFVGFTSRPFLGSIAKDLMSLAPKAGDSAYQIDSAGQVAIGVVDLPPFVYPAALFTDGAAALAAYEGNDVLGITASLGKNKVRLIVKGDHPQLINVQHEDPSRRPFEWLVEVVYTYGDGFYSRLIAIDGTALNTGTGVDTRIISSSSGERGTATDFEWRVLPDGSVVVVRSGHPIASGNRFTFNGKFVKYSPTPSGAVH
jgi:hypothetical protein